MPLRPTDTAVTTPTRQEIPGRVDLSAPVVVCIEDSAENWEITQLRLRRHFRLLWARNDQDACALVKTHQRELSAILMDVELQGSTLNGVQLTQLLRGTLDAENIPPFARGVPRVDVPIFFVTAHGSSASDQTLLAAGGTKTIAKPVDFAELSFALAQVRISSMPSTGARVAIAAAEPDFSIEALRSLIDEDPVFAQRFDKASRFEAFGEGLRPDAPQRDECSIRYTAATLAVIDLLPAGTRGEQLLVNALRRAVAAWRLGQLFRLPSCKCLGLGMMLESGLVARAQHDLEGAYKVARMPAMARSVHESAAGEGRHAWRGAQLAHDWRLPTDFVVAVERHHSSRPSEGILARVAWLAEALAGVFEVGDHRVNQKFALRACREANLPDDDVLQIMENLPAEVEVAAAALGRPVASLPRLPQLMARSSSSLENLYQSYQELVLLTTEIIGEKDALADCLRAGQVRLAQEATTDVLTRLANRRAFDEALEGAVARAAHTDSVVGLILLDLDHFKRVNDIWGHQVGDEVLKLVARVIREATREGDFTARYGGEEFAILLYGAVKAKSVAVAERIRTELEKRSVTAPDGEEIFTTASFGVAVLTGPVNLEDGAEFIAPADSALYEAKESGRNRVIVADSVGAAD